MSVKTKSVKITYLQKLNFSRYTVHVCLILLEWDHMNYTIAIDTIECFTASYNGNQLVTVLTKILSSNHGNETKLTSARWYVKRKNINNKPVFHK